MATWRVPIDLTWTGASGSPGVNVWHIRTTGGPGPSDDLEEMTQALFAFYNGIKAVFPNALSIRWAGEASGVGDDTGDTATSPGWTVTGTGDTGFLPPANSLIASWRTSGGGRQGRGRTFLGPLGNGANEANGTPTEGTRTLIETAQADLIETSDSFANGAVGIYSRVGGTFRDLISGTCPNMFAELRSRRD